MEKNTQNCLWLGLGNKSHSSVTSVFILMCAKFKTGINKWESLRYHLWFLHSFVMKMCFSTGFRMSNLICLLCLLPFLVLYIFVSPLHKLVFSAVWYPDYAPVISWFKKTNKMALRFLSKFTFCFMAISGTWQNTVFHCLCYIVDSWLTRIREALTSNCS